MTTIIPFTSLLGKLLFCCGVLTLLASEPAVFVAAENHLKGRAPFAGNEASGLPALKQAMAEWSLDDR